MPNTLRTKRFSSFHKPERGTTPKTLREIFYENWLPPIIAATLALIGGVALAKLNEDSTERKVYLELRIKVADQIASSSSQLLDNHRKLIIIRNFMDEECHSTEKKKSDDCTGAETNSNKYLTSRDSAKETLVGALGTSRLYFTESFSEEAEKFINFINNESIKPINEQQPSKWNDQQLQLIKLLKQEISGEKNAQHNLLL